MGRGRTKRGSPAAKSGQTRGRGNTSEDSSGDYFRRDQAAKEDNETEGEKVENRVEEQGSEGDSKTETSGDDHLSESQQEASSGQEKEGSLSREESVTDLNGTDKEVSNHESEGQVEDMEADTDQINSIPDSENEGSENNGNEELYSCDHCGHKTGSRAELVAHMSAEHENKRKNSLLDLKGKKLLKTSHSEGVRSITVTPSKRLPPNRFKIEYTCDLCSEFRARNLIQVLSHRAGHLNSHKMSASALTNDNHHGNNNNNGRKTNAIEYDCSRCDFKASNLIRVLSHIDSCHPEDRPGRPPGVYTCDVCPFKTPRLITLMSHRSVNHFADRRLTAVAARPPAGAPEAISQQVMFSCDMCKFKTNERERLARHAERHVGERLHACSDCNYKTLHLQKFQDHLSTRHGGSMASRRLDAAQD